MEDVSVLMVHFYEFDEEKLSDKRTKVLDVAGALKPFFQSKEGTLFVFRVARHEHAKLDALRARLAALNTTDYTTSLGLNFKMRKLHTEPPRTLDMFNRKYLDETTESMNLPMTRGVSALKVALNQRNEDWRAPLYWGDIAGTPLEVAGVLPGMGPLNLKFIKDELATHGLSFGMDLEGWTPPPPPSALPIPPIDVLMRRVDTLRLSRRARNTLESDRIVLMGDLVSKTEAEMLRSPNFGRKSLQEMKEELAKIGCSFGMELPDWPPDVNT